MSDQVALAQFAAREQARASRAQSYLRAIWQFARHKPLGALGAVIIVALVVTAAAPGLFTSRDPAAFDGLHRLKAPAGGRILGTDQNGRDEFSRIVHGARTSVSISFGAIAISVVLATAIGTLSGYLGGAVDAALQRLVDAALAFPYLVVLITLVAVLGPGVSQIIVALGLISCFGMSRVIRSVVIGISSQPYIEAARVLGASPLRIMIRHVILNVLPIVIITASVSMGGLVLAEAGLSFLGFGVPPPTPSWGSMLSIEGRAYMEQAPWLAIVPGVAIASIVFAFNMLGDALRDTLDPRLRR
jgi:peptide/nickel transport system permease protein